MSRIIIIYHHIISEKYNVELGRKPFPQSYCCYLILQNQKGPTSKKKRTENDTYSPQFGFIVLDLCSILLHTSNNAKQFGILCHLRAISFGGKLKSNSTKKTILIRHYVFHHTCHFVLHNSHSIQVLLRKIDQYPPECESVTTDAESGGHDTFT